MTTTTTTTTTTITTTTTATTTTTTTTTTATTTYDPWRHEPAWLETATKPNYFKSENASATTTKSEMRAAILFVFYWLNRLEYIWRPVGLMDKASASGAGDSRFEFWAGHSVFVCWVSNCFNRMPAIANWQSHKCYNNETRK